MRVAAVLLVGLIAAGARPRREALRHPITVALAVLTAVLVAATVAGIEPRASWEGGYFRRHGLTTWLALVVVHVSMLGVTTQRLLYALIAGSVVPAAYAVAQCAGVDPIEWSGMIEGRAASTAGNALLLAGYLAVVTPVTACEAIRSWNGGNRRRRILMTVSLASVLLLQVAALAATGSRAPIAACVAGVMAGGILASRNWRRPAVAAAVVVLLVAVAAATGASAMGLFEQGSGRVRVLIWKGISQLFESNPQRLTLGYGPDTLRLVMPKYYDPEIGRIEGTEAMPDRAHNETLDMLVSGGVPAAAAMLALFALVIGCAARVDDRLVRAALVGAAVAHAIEIQLGIATVMSRLAFFAVGAAVVVSTVAHRQAIGGRDATRPRVPRRNRSTDFATCGAACAVAAALAWPIMVVPSRADGLSRDGEALQRQGNWPAAVAAYRRAAALQPQEPEYLTRLARALLAPSSPGEAGFDGALDEAEGVLRRARSLNPYDPHQPRNLASVARRRAAATSDAARRHEYLQQADLLYAAATELSPGLPSLWVEWANVAAERRQAGIGLTRLERARRLDPDRAEMWMLRAVLLAQLGRFEEARASVTRLLQLDPENRIGRRLAEALNVAP